MKHAKKLAACAVGAAGLLVIGLMTGAKTQEVEIIEVDSRIVVETTAPRTGDIVVTGEYVGTVEPGHQVVVYPKVSGEVLEVYFGIGDTVEQGEVLLQLDSTSLQYDISLAQASLSKNQSQAQLSLEQARQNLEIYDSGIEDGYNSTLMNAEAAVEKAEVAVEKAGADLVSARRTYREVRDDEWEDVYTDVQIMQYRDAVVQAEIGLESAQLTLEQAEAALEATKQQLSDQRISSETAVRSAEVSNNFSSDYISIQKMQNTLADYTIASPIGGVIEQRGVDPYDMASTGTPVYVISNKDAMTVSFQVSETTWSNMRAGDAVTIEKQGQSWPGTIVEIATMANANGGLYTVKANVENAPFEMNTGSTIKVFAEMQSSRNTMLVPIDSIYYDGSTPYVFVYQNGLAERATLETGMADAESIEVLSGLSGNESIITTWNSALMEGTEVILAEEAARLLEEQEMEGIHVEDTGDEAADQSGPDESGTADRSGNPEAAE